jgi:hypothetical protein
MPHECQGYAAFTRKKKGQTLIWGLAFEIDLLSDDPSLFGQDFHGRNQTYLRFTSSALGCGAGKNTIANNTATLWFWAEA